MADGKRRYKSDRKDYKESVKLSEKDMDILKVALKQTGMTASAYIRELIRTGGKPVSITGMHSCNSSISHRRKMEIIINQL